MSQVIVCIPGRVPHTIPESALAKFLARHPDAISAPVIEKSAASAPDAAVPQSKALGKLKKAELQELLMAEFSLTPPREWGRTRLIEELRTRRRKTPEGDGA
jgi:hypothetical protein